MGRPQPFVFMIIILMLLAGAQASPAGAVEATYSIRNKEIVQAAHLSLAAPSQTQAERAVLMEMFSWVNCPPCYYADTALEQISGEYNRDELIILTYLHDATQQPVGDTAGTANRASLYGMNSYPTAVFDGGGGSGGAGVIGITDDTAATYRKETDTRMPIYTPIDITMYHTTSGNTVTVNTVFHARAELHQSLLKAYIALYEDDVYYPGTNGISTHHYMFREFVETDYTLDLVNRNSVEVEKSFAIDPSWDKNKLGVIAFVQAAGPFTYTVDEAVQGSAESSKEGLDVEDVVLIVVGALAALGILYIADPRSLLESRGRGPCATEYDGPDAESFLKCPLCQKRIKKKNIYIHMEKMHGRGACKKMQKILDE